MQVLWIHFQSISFPTVSLGTVISMDLLLSLPILRLQRSQWWLLPEPTGDMVQTDAADVIPSGMFSGLKWSM